jgi:hypothetical protein
MHQYCDSSKDVISTKGMVKADIASMPRSHESSNDGCSTDIMVVSNITHMPRSRDKEYVADIA